MVSGRRAATGAELVGLLAELHADRLSSLPDAEALDLLAARKSEREAQGKRSADPEQQACAVGADVRDLAAPSYILIHDDAPIGAALPRRSPPLWPQDGDSEAHVLTPSLQAATAADLICGNTSAKSLLR